MIKGAQLYEGKAKKVFSTDDPELLIVDYKDDATAFNGLKKGTITGKGIINNHMSNLLMQRLEKKGLIHRDAMKPRAMEVSGVTPNDSSVSVPLIGHVTAGIPILAEENLDEFIQLPTAMVGEGSHFILQVHGDSMINAGILDGDFIVVHQQVEANNGEIVVAMIDDSATVKRFYKENGHFRLQPENPVMEPIIVPEVTILGKVISLYRMMK